MKKITLIMIFSFMILTVNSWDKFDVNTFMSNDDINKIVSGEIITRMYLKYDAEGENTDLSIKIPVTQFVNEDLSNYEMITDEKAFIPYDLEKEGKIKFYNTITAASKLKGMKYYSRKAGEVLELIVDCFQTNEKGKKIDDIKYESIDKYIKGTFRQKDNKFGTLDFTNELYNDGNDFALVTTCNDSIPLVSKGGEYKVCSYFFYDETKKGFYYYTVYVMKIRNEMFLKKGGIITLHPTTFSNRLRAATTHLAILLGNDWGNKRNPWDEDKLKAHFYRNYK